MGTLAWHPPYTSSWKYAHGHSSALIRFSQARQGCRLHIQLWRSLSDTISVDTARSWSYCGVSCLFRRSRRDLYCFSLIIPSAPAPSALGAFPGEHVVLMIGRAQVILVLAILAGSGCSFELACPETCCRDPITAY